MISPNAEKEARSSGLPMPTSTGSDEARTKPMIIAAIIAPRTEPIVPSTTTAKEGSRMLSPTSGLTRVTIAKSTPPSPEMPAERNALVAWMRSTWIPEEAARSGLSATARICRPSRVRFSSSSSSSTAAKTPIISSALL